MLNFWKRRNTCPYCGQLHKPPCLLEALDRELSTSKVTPAAPRLLDRILFCLEADYASAERGRAQNARAVDGEGE